MTILASLRRGIERIQALPDRHLTALYATLAVFTAGCVRINTEASGAAIVVAFVSVGAFRAVKHHG